MTQDESIRMALEAGLIKYVQVEKTCVSNALERFAALVFAAGATHEREKQADISALPIIIEAAVKEAVLAEREACAKVCEEEHDKSKFGVNWMHCAAAIRARSNHG